MSDDRVVPLGDRDGHYFQRSSELTAWHMRTKGGEHVMYVADRVVNRLRELQAEVEALKKGIAP